MFCSDACERTYHETDTVPRTVEVDLKMMDREAWSDGVGCCATCEQPCHPPLTLERLDRYLQRGCKLMTLEKNHDANGSPVHE